MKNYDRLFGAGPRGAVLSVMLLLMVFYLERQAGLPAIFSETENRLVVVSICGLLGLLLVSWSLVSLPPKERGRHLVTTGAFRYIRHPLYAAFLVFFNPGFAILMNNWIYIGWAVILIPIWVINVKGEEQLMKSEFGEEYGQYCKKSWRFFPGV